MRKVVRRPRFWLVLGWKAAMRLARRTPLDHPARPFVLAAGRTAEDWYWRQVRSHLRSAQPVRPRWTK